jgi:hypothetical protein
MPRRKYGHMVSACPPTPAEKCRACRLGHPCPIHDEKNKPDFDTLAKKKHSRFSGGKKWRKRQREKAKKTKKAKKDKKGETSK